MPFTLDIIPHVPSLDMYGSARSGTAYSLSGEIVLTLTSSSSSSSLFGGSSSSSSGAGSPASGPSSRPTTIYLSSLNVTFEGRTEILSHNCGYAPFRLCQVDKELVSSSGSDGKPIALSNRGQKNGVMRWKMTFDLAVPGWLPPSSQLDEQGSGTSYALYAHAKFSDDFETALSAVTAVPVTSTGTSSSTTNPRSSSPALSSSPSSRPATPSGMASYLPTVPGLSGSINLSALNPFSSFSRSKLRNAHASPVSIKVNRFRTPKSLNPFGGAPDFTQPLVPPHIYHPTPSLFPVLLESVETRVTMPASGKDSEEGKRIPLDILGGIEVVAGVPEYVGMSEEKIPLSLRVRSTNSDSVNKGLVLEAFDVEVEQMEKFRSVPCERFLSNYPVPPTSQQPPNKPFLTPNPLEGLYSLGLAAANEAVQWTRTVPMLPTKRVNFRPSPATGGLEVDGEWAKMDLAIGVLRKEDMEETSNAATTSTNNDEPQDEEKLGRNLRRKILNPDFDTPFVKVRHEMKIALRLSWLPEHAADEIARTAGAMDGEQLRKARMAHPERKTETLLMSLSIKMAAVSQGVQKMFKTLGVHYGAPIPISPSVAPTMRRTLAQSRCASPAPSLTTASSYSSSPSSARTSPASGVMALPSVMGLSIPGRSDSPAPSVASSSSHRHSLSISASSCSAGLHPLAVVFPGPFVLPPYSELYHSNGERKEE
ncbi:hypothetical protein FRC01_010948, partial [Tulasnella sp. 417]